MRTGPGETPDGVAHQVGLDDQTPTKLRGPREARDEGPRASTTWRASGVCNGRAGSVGGFTS